MAAPEDEDELKRLFECLEEARQLGHDRIDELEAQIEEAKRKCEEKLPESRSQTGLDHL